MSALIDMAEARVRDAADLLCTASQIANRSWTEPDVRAAALGAIADALICLSEVRASPWVSSASRECANEALKSYLAF